MEENLTPLFFDNLLSIGFGFHTHNLKICQRFFLKEVDWYRIGGWVQIIWGLEGGNEVKILESRHKKIIPSVWWNDFDWGIGNGSILSLVSNFSAIDS
jgi:hypothetical protein